MSWFSERGKELETLNEAVRLGGKKLADYDGERNRFYEASGFVAESRADFDPKQAPKGWDYEKQGKPDILFWRYAGEEAAQAAKPTDVESLWKSNYEVAEEWRDTEIRKAEEENANKTVEEEKQPVNEHMVDKNGIMKEDNTEESTLKNVDMAGQDNVYLGDHYRDYVEEAMLKGRVVVNSYDFAETINHWWEEVGYDKPPYKPGTLVQEIVLKEDISFVRVYDNKNTFLQGGWVMRPEDIVGLTPVEIQEKFALPFLPKYIGEVKLKAGDTIRVGEVNENYDFHGGGIQFDLKKQYIGEFKPMGTILEWSGRNGKG